MLYSLFTKLVGVCFNTLNFILGGNLPPFGSVCIIVEEQGRFLVIKRPKGELVFPSGFMRWNEYPSQTAEREAMEETGLKLRIGNVVSCYSTKSSSIDRLSTLTFVYAAEVISGELRSSVEGQPIWIEESELAKRISSRFKYLLNDYRSYQAQHTQVNVSASDLELPLL